MSHYLDDYSALLIEISRIPTAENPLKAHQTAALKAEAFCAKLFSLFVTTNLPQYVMDEYLCAVEEKLEERTFNILN